MLHAVQLEGSSSQQRGSIRGFLVLGSAGAAPRRPWQQTLSQGGWLSGQGGEAGGGGQELGAGGWGTFKLCILQPRPVLLLNTVDLK